MLHQFFLALTTNTVQDIKITVILLSTSFPTSHIHPSLLFTYDQRKKATSSTSFILLTVSTTSYLNSFFSRTAQEWN